MGCRHSEQRRPGAYLHGRGESLFGPVRQCDFQWVDSLGPDADIGQLPDSREFHCWRNCQYHDRASMKGLADFYAGARATGRNSVTSLWSYIDENTVAHDYTGTCTDAVALCPKGNS